MQKELCICCSDINRYNRKVYEVSKKLSLLQRILSIQRIEDTEYKEFRKKHNLFILQNDSTHAHFRCGTCFQINESKLRLKEDLLREILYQVFFLIYKTKDEKLYYNTLRMLQGDYPITYNCLERMWYKRQKEVNYD